MDQADIVISFNKRNVVIPLFISLVTAVLFAHFFSSYKQEELLFIGLLPHWIQSTILLSGVSFSILLLIACVFRLVKNTPALRIDRTGINDRSHLFSLGVITWDEVDEITVFELHNTKWIGIIPKDINAYFAKKGMWGLIKQLGISAFGGTPIMIPEKSLTMTAEEVCLIIEQQKGH